MFAQVPKAPPRSKKLSSARDSLNCDNVDFSSHNYENSETYDIELIAYPSYDRPYKKCQKVARSLTLPSRKRGEKNVLLSKNEKIYRIVRRSSNMLETNLSEIERLSSTHSTPLANGKSQKQLSENYERSGSSTPIVTEQILSPNTKTKLLTKLTALFKYCNL